MKKVRKFFKNYCKFLNNKDINECFCDNMPHPKDLRKDDDEFRKRELYLLFNFYIPITGMLDGGYLNNKSYRDTHLFKRLHSYITSNEVMEAIIEL